jgi:uncharacterized protein
LGRPRRSGILTESVSSEAVVRRAQRRIQLSRLDLRNPFVVDTRDLGRRAGAMLKLSRTVPAPALLGVDVIGVPEGSDIVLDVRLESVVEGVLVSGTAQMRFEGECVRCLDPLAFTKAVPLQELFFYPDQAVDDDEVSRLQGDALDLQPVVRDAVVLGLPFQPVCRDDCPGLCPQCGVRLADVTDHQHDQVDLRWAGLEQLQAQRDLLDRLDVKEES